MSTFALKSPALRLRKRSIAIMLSLLLAAGATAALFTYVHGVENRSATAAENVPAFVAKVAIAANTPADLALSKGVLEQVMVPRRLLVPGVITSLAQVQGKVAAVDIAAGEQIVASRFVSALERPTLLPIPSGHQAFTVAADNPNSVGGFVQPGDHVSVIAKITPKEGGAITHYVVQNVSVLAVGQTIASSKPATSTTKSDDSTTTSATSINLTLAVTPSDAEKLAFAVLEGDVYFTLIPAGQGPAKTGGRTASNLFTR